MYVCTFCTEAPKTNSCVCKHLAIKLFLKSVTYDVHQSQDVVSAHALFHGSAQPNRPRRAAPRCCSCLSWRVCVCAPSLTASPPERRERWAARRYQTLWLKTPEIYCNATMAFCFSIIKTCCMQQMTLQPSPIWVPTTEKLVNRNSLSCKKKSV